MLQMIVASATHEAVSEIVYSAGGFFLGTACTVAYAKATGCELQAPAFWRERHARRAARRQHRCARAA